MKYKIYHILLFIGLLLPAGAASAGVHTWAEKSALAEGAWVKVALSSPNDGIYQISYSQLRNWGFTDPSQVGVYGFGGHLLNESFAVNHIDDLPEVATLHDTNGQRILFYGRGIISWSYQDDDMGYVQQQHPYATYATYFLHQKSGKAPLTLAQDTVNAQPDITLSEYEEYWLHESESVNIGETGRQWYGESFISSASQSFILPEESHLSGHTFKAGTARIAVGFVTHTPATTSFSVSLASKTLGSQSISATTNQYGYGTEGVFSQKLTTQGALNNVRIGINYSHDGTSATVARLNYIRLQGRCALEASSSEAFRLFRHHSAISKRAAYRLSGITSRMQVWDVTSPTDIRRQMLQGDSLFTASAKGLREYAIVNLASSAFPTVSQLGSVNCPESSLHSLDAPNLIILTPSGLYSQALALAEHRFAHDNLSYVVLTPELIYNEYSSGVPDVTAIRLFLKHMYEKGIEEDGSHTLRYFLLFGDGTYDNRTACYSSTWLPTYQTQYSLSETASHVCDDYFGFLDDNEGTNLASDKLDIGVGRIPVSSTNTAQDVVDKLISYDNDQYGNWKNRICFLSDDDKIENNVNLDSRNAHMKHNDALIQYLEKAGHYEYMYQKIYLPSYQQTTSASGTDYPDARKLLNNALQQGSLLINYAGHGSTTTITHEMLMTAQSAKELRMKHLPVWITASCDVSRFDADKVSLGENLMLNAQGGAAALITTSRTVYASQNLTLNKAIMHHLFDRLSDGSRARLGDILRSAKVEVCNSIANDDNKLSFFLMGDPSMTLAYPDQKMVIDSIEGSFTALGSVTVSGHVLKSGSTETDTDFDGLVYSTIFDVQDSLTADKGVHDADEIYTFASRTRKVFMGRDMVKGGYFRFSLTIPQELSFKKGNGLINLYACSENGTEANGYYDQVYFLRNSSTSTQDTVAPEILYCFLENERFTDGDAVGLTPLFYAEVRDSSGINTTGNSIGHDVALTIRCLSNPLVTSRQIVLNDYFTTFTGEPNHGNVKYSLTDLEEGTYEATFRVWDIYNNTSSRTFTFKVSNSTHPTFALLQAYPSPVHSGETVTFRALHNRPESADCLRLQVYTQTGIKVLDETISSSSCEAVYLKPGATRASQISNNLNADETAQILGSSQLKWTANVVPGVYVYRAYLTAGGEEAASQSRLLIVY